jgi:hypothetical protein
MIQIKCCLFFIKSEGGKKDLATKSNISFFVVVFFASFIPALNHITFGIVVETYFNLAKKSITLNSLLCKKCSLKWYLHLEKINFCPNFILETF